MQQNPMNTGHMKPLAFGLEPSVPGALLAPTLPADEGNVRARGLVLEWVVGPADSADGIPEKSVAAQIPGSAIYDWARGHGWPEYWTGGEALRYKGLEGYFWHYEAVLPAIERATGERLLLTALGIDYAFSVLLGDRILYEQEGMFTPFSLDLSGPQLCAGERLRILVRPAPKSGKGHRAFDRSVKPGVSYGWDFHPPINTLGIWRDLRLEVRPAADLRSLSVHTELTPDLKTGRFSIELTTAGADGMSTFVELLDPRGAPVWSNQARINGAVTERYGEISDPLLWEPWTLGTPHQYTLRATLADQSLTRKCGFRRVRLVANVGAEGKPHGGTRPYAEMTLEVNGTRIFGRGVNWVSPDVFYGATSASRYRDQVQLLREGNLNLVRLWGGAPSAARDAFYEACDEFGILVWQDFPLAGVTYSEESAFLQILDREARSIIRRIRQHPSLAIWCGGNELIIWGRNSEHSPLFRVLDSACLDLDPQTPFFPSTPHFGANHGPYRYDGMWNLLQKEVTANAEFGVPGMHRLEMIRQMISADELFPVAPTPSWVLHKGLKAFGPQGWIQPDQIENAFGPSAAIGDLIANSRRLQAAGIKFAYEESRRQWPFNSMALAWVFNEPWPCAANNSLVGWPSDPKPAYYAAREALRDSLASARYFKPVYSPGENFSAELWVLNDAAGPLDAGHMEAVLRSDDTVVAKINWCFPGVAARANLQGPRLDAALPAGFEGVLTLELVVAGRKEMDSCYDIFVRSR